MAKGVKTGGRKLGSLNKATRAGLDSVMRAERLLKKRAKTLRLEDVSAALLTCGNLIVAQRELQTLREYRFGKPSRVKRLVTGEPGIAATQTARNVTLLAPF